MSDKLKVAMVCHFSSAKVRQYLPLDNRRLYRLVRKMLFMPAKDSGYGDVAGWDTYIIEELRKRPDIDLYVISAHNGLKKSVYQFELEGVHYNFVRCDRATLLKRLIPSAKLWHKLNPMRPVVRKLVYKIQPDVIALIGAENAYYSGTVVGIKGIPVILKCQTIYNNSERIKNDIVDKKNAYVERLIFKDLQYVAVGRGIHSQLFRQFNQTAYNFKWKLGNLLPEVKPMEKEFDFVNFAMLMLPKKGFPDAIEALAIVKKDYPEVKLNLIGGGSAEEVESLHRLVESLELTDNVVFSPFFPNQEDLFQHLQRSRFALLPCKMDTISSTIRQAMHYELPVICYETDGTPKLNQEKECVLIAKNGDVKDLAAKMSCLLGNKEKGEELSRNAKEFSERWNDDARNAQQMVDNFHAIVDHYRNGTPIPRSLLVENE